ncbi:LLM class flavin-dependent oxidoreductase [Luteipulveratus sp. YIM 133132]|uniref:LLM class flavin-dependent oxidoreductase n=1 Tax=Luteipulveratus flavus TaxID=3031728 RepID=UPI0023AECC55|nr:LLM class flavin-dependent oxidoreductase [Luteipulveratus sp. YIM 133132]MDE9364932.1 LLM class flavin-dependent oxidoreductase [Luteipulveratus sp. YIM 133132]
MTVSVLFGQQVDRLGPLVDTARLCAERDLTLWLGQSMKIETHAALAAVAGHGVSVETGLGVTLAPLRTPFEALTQARSVAALMGRRVHAGYGIGSMSMAQGLLQHALPRPASYVAGYLSDLKALQATAEDPTAHHPGLRMMPMEAPEVQVGCGVLRPGMARTAGGVADFVVSWLTPLSYLATTLLSALDEGAARAGRKRPRVVSIVPCAVDRPGRTPVRLAAGSCGAHVQLPHYADMLRTAGVHLTGDRASDLRAALHAGLFTYGSPQDIADTVSAHLRSGVDEVVLNMGSVGLQHGVPEALQDLEAVLDRLPEVPTTERR